MSDSEIVIALIYPSLLGTYGDRGNAQVLQRRLQWRGITARVLEIGLDDTIPESCDIYLLGGAEDGPGRTAAELLAAQPGLSRAVNAGRPVLAVCAGMQLLGHHIGEKEGGYRGLGLLDVTTTITAPTRTVGEITIRPTGDWSDELITGFENHRGSTSIGPGAQPLGLVLHGVGNGAGEPVEGAFAGHIIATYLHGPVLARNPALADRLLAWAVGTALEPLPMANIDELRKERLLAAR
jgi:CobQ-like glutamine amidotransferase family enzyme